MDQSLWAPVPDLLLAALAVASLLLRVSASLLSEVSPVTTAMCEMSWVGIRDGQRGIPTGGLHHRHRLTALVVRIDISFKGQKP